MSEFAIGLIGTSALLILVFAGVRVFVVAAIVGLLGCVAIIGWKVGQFLIRNRLIMRSASSLCLF